MKYGLGYFQLTLHKTLKICYRFPRLITAVFVVLILISASFLPQTRYILTADDMREDSFPSQNQLEDLQNSFKEGPSSLLSLSKKKGAWTEVEP